jgi:hypothetical protein
MDWFKSSRITLALALLSFFCANPALEAKTQCASCNEIDQEAYERGRADEANGYPYHSYVRSTRRYSYNLGRKEMRDELQSDSAQKPVKISPYVCRFYAKQISASQLYDHGPMYNTTYGDLR